MITNNSALTWTIFWFVATILITAYLTIQEYMSQKSWEKDARDKIQFIIRRTIAPSFTLAALLTMITFVINLLVYGTHNTY